MDKDVRSTQKLPHGGTRKSPRLNNLKQANDANMTSKSGTAKRKLDLQNESHEDENMGENDLEVRYAQFPVFSVL